MPALVFNKCCGCIELKTGCLIIGYLQLIGELICAALILVGLAMGGALASGAIHDDKHPETDTREVGVFILVLMVILLIFIVLALAFTIALLVGLHKERRGHVKAYLIYATIFLVIGVILFFASLANKPRAVDIVNNLVQLVLNTYFLLVIRSHYIKMGDSYKGPAVYNTA